MDWLEMEHPIKMDDFGGATMCLFGNLVSDISIPRAADSKCPPRCLIPLAHFFGRHPCIPEPVFTEAMEVKTAWSLLRNINFLNSM